MRSLLNVILNLLWLVMGGIFIALGYALAGVLAFVFIITIPFGVAAFRMANYALWPFGRTLVRRDSAGLGSAIGNVAWVILFGWWLAIGHIITAVVQFVSIVGIPVALANIKLIPVSLFPLGQEIVDNP